MPDTRVQTIPEHGINFQYATQTLNGPLHSHLCHLHYDLYISTCKQVGWDEYLQEHEKPGYVANHAAALPAPHGPSASLIPFSQEGLINALVKFIVADNQVKLSISRFIFLCSYFINLVYLHR